MKIDDSAPELNAQELDILENDAVWSVLDTSPSHDASPAAKPLFSRDVMRQIRLMDEQSQPWWKTIFSSTIAKVLIPAGAVTACVLAYSVFSSPHTQETADIDDSAAASHSAASSTDQSTEDIDAHILEIQALQNEDPIFLSTDDIEYLVNN